MSGRRSGVTLIEILVVISILGLVVGLLIPAIQSSREAARRATCQNNLKQVGLALQSHASSQGVLPSFYNGSLLPQPRWALDEFHFHSWRAAILPHLEASTIAGALNFALPSTVAANQTAVNIRLAVFNCPTTGNRGRVVPAIAPWGASMAVPFPSGTAAQSDYEAVGGIQVARQTRGSNDLSIIEMGAWGEPTYEYETGKSLRYRPARLSDISDGLANTILVAERAGRPDVYQRGKPVEPYVFNSPQGMDNHQAAWAISTHFWWVVLTLPTARVNDSNYGVFSFHQGGAHVTLADGSVRFLKESTAPAVLKSLTTRSGAEIVAAD